MGFQEFLGKFGLLAFCPVGASCPLVIHSLEISVLKREIWQFLLTAPECFQEITPTWLSAVLHLLPCRNLYFCPPWPPGNCSCSNYSCLLFLSFLTLKVPFVYPPCPQLLFSVTGNPLTACPAQSSGSSLLPLLLQYLVPCCPFLIHSVSFPTTAGFKSLFAVGYRKSTYGVPGDAVLAAAHAFCLCVSPVVQLLLNLLVKLWKSSFSVVTPMHLHCRWNVGHHLWWVTQWFCLASLKIKRENMLWRVQVIVQSSGAICHAGMAKSICSSQLQSPCSIFLIII